MLGEQYYEVVNAGASGQTMLKDGLCYPVKVDKCSYRDTDAWKRALDSKAEIFTIMLGTNDAKTFNWQGVQMDQGDFYGVDYLDMIRELHALEPSPKAIFLMVSPPLFTNSTGQYVYHMDPNVINKILPKLIPDLASVAGSAVTGVIDVQGAILASPLAKDDSNLHLKLQCDGCHPTAIANKIIAETMVPFILAVGSSIAR